MSLLILFILLVLLVLCVPQHVLPTWGVQKKRAPVKQPCYGVLNRRDEEATGVVLAQYDSPGGVLRDDGEGHVFVLGQATLHEAVAIPTLLDWEGSAIVLDVGGEKYRKTAQWRSRQGAVLHFNPCDVEGARFNPLLEIRRAHLSEDLERFVSELLREESGLHVNVVRTALEIVILHVLGVEDDKTLLRCISRLYSGEILIQQILGSYYEDQELDALIHTRVERLLQVPAMQRASIWNQAREVLSRVSNEALNRGRDFTWRQFQHDTERPSTLYLVVSRGLFNRFRPLLRLMLGQLLATCTSGLNTPRTHHLLLMLDELEQLGPLDELVEVLTQASPPGLKCVFLVQSMCSSPGFHDMARCVRDVCQLCVASHEVSIQDLRLLIAPSGEYTDVMRATAALGPEDLVLCKPSDGPILARQFRYEANEEFSSRLQDTTDLLEHQSPVPQKSEWEEVASPVTCASAPVEPQELTLTHVSSKEEVLNQELKPTPPIMDDEDELLASAPTQKISFDKPS